MVACCALSSQSAGGCVSLDDEAQTRPGTSEICHAPILEGIFNFHWRLSSRRLLSLNCCCCPRSHAERSAASTLSKMPTSPLAMRPCWTARDRLEHAGPVSPRRRHRKRAQLLHHIGVHGSCVRRRRYLCHPFTISHKNAKMPFQIDFTGKVSLHAVNVARPPHAESSIRTSSSPAAIEAS